MSMNMYQKAQNRSFRASLIVKMRTLLKVFGRDGPFTRVTCYHTASLVIT